MPHKCCKRHRKSKKSKKHSKKPAPVVAPLPYYANRVGFAPVSMGGGTVDLTRLDPAGPLFWTYQTAHNQFI